MFFYILYSYLTAWIGVQISLPELKLFCGKYNYKLAGIQWMTLSCFILFIFAVTYDFIKHGVGITLFMFFACFIIAFLKEWFWSKINPSSIKNSIIYHLIIIGFLFGSFYKMDWVSLSMPFIFGLYFRNCPFGVIHNKPLFISSWIKRNRRMYENLHVNLQNDISSNNALNSHYVVSDYGIQPNEKSDQTKKLQNLVNEVGKQGGGIIYFPKGKYFFNGYIQINYSNVVLEGEIANDGFPLAELILCNKTVYGKKNPWLSPFFITTGEQIQRSNMFWGLQFRKKKNIVTRSGSLADPGSDGEILTPNYATKVIRTSLKGENCLYVEDSTKLSKYILLGLYNTSIDGNLIKDILGVTELREEWGTARRAGEEEAPSYQWLVEIANVIDEHTIELSEPLLRDCDMIYTPEVYNVDMLENIIVRNLRLNTKWNGLFRHHGFPLYYTIKQSQEMDYGWNGINMKRVAHGQIENVILKNFTNPLYVMDSRNIISRNLTIEGYDGHQGIKVYEHACNNVFENIVFFNHYADMLGGEGNAYGNIFRNIHYLNPNFKPVDFDFHGFSEGPMSPPSHNLFDKIIGFRYIKTAGALYNMPGCGQFNKWKNIVSEGEKKGTPLFVSLPYIPKSGIFKIISASRHSLVTAAQNKNFSYAYIRDVYKERIKEMNEKLIPISRHWMFYKNSILENYSTTSTYPKDEFILLSSSKS